MAHFSQWSFLRFREIQTELAEWAEVDGGWVGSTIRYLFDGGSHRSQEVEWWPKQCTGARGTSSSIGGGGRGRNGRVTTYLRDITEDGKYRLVCFRLLVRLAS